MVPAALGLLILMRAFPSVSAEEGAMSPEELLAASMERVSADTEKLTRRNMKECVAEHIQTMCLSDPAFARKVMHPRKSMIRCFQYISRKAWAYIQDELEGQRHPARSGTAGIWERHS